MKEKYIYFMENIFNTYLDIQNRLFGLDTIKKSQREEKRTFENGSIFNRDLFF